jgi:hypothetical protein
LNGYIYIAGGCTSTGDCTTASSNVQYALLGADGSIGTWTNTTAALTAVRTWGKLVNAGGSLYYLGGQDSTSTNEQSTIYYATPSSGDVTAWSTATKAIGDTGSGGQARTKFGAAVWNNRIYVVGGLDGSAANTSTVYVSPQQSSGGNITSNWTSTTAFNVARSGPAVTVYANNLYLLGGDDGTNYFNDVQYTQIASTGTVGTWSYSTSLPGPISGGEAVSANGYMYLLGGRSASTTCNSSTKVTPISANTTIATGNNPTGIGSWYETNQKYSGNRYGNAAAYNDGKIYILGGACGSTLTYTGANRVVQTTVLSQPQIAKYSRMIDMDKEVFPTYWVMNGLDNSIGARWSMNYRSMGDPNSTSCMSPAMTTWGTTVSYGNITLGDVAPWVVKDGSAVTKSCARYYYLNVSIDSSQAYGYPEDVTRGPTIDDISLFYNANPSKRLRNGKTFTGGLQQPLDTPCRQSVDADCPLP